MHKIKIGSKTWKFKTSFGEFTCENIKEYMNIHQKMDDTRELLKAHYNSIKPLENKFSKELDFEKSKKLRGLIVDAKCNCASAQMYLHLHRVDLLANLCYQNDFRQWALHTNGVDKDIIDACLEAIFDKLKGFTDFWETVPPIESFSIGRSRWFKKKFKLHDMDSTTLYRDTISHNILSRAMTERSKLDDGYFDDICQFVATITRPANEKEEISFNSKAFIKGKETKGLSNSEKLTYYVEKLDESIEQRTKLFKNLPLSIAIGVIVGYFEKKKRYEKSMNESTKPKNQL